MPAEGQPLPSSEEYTLPINVQGLLVQGKVLPGNFCRHVVLAVKVRGVRLAVVRDRHDCSARVRTLSTAPSIGDGDRGGRGAHVGTHPLDGLT